MMIINASYAPSVFFNQAANGLCPNTYYFFSAYIFNLMIPGPITASYNHPDITFSIQTPSGQVLATLNTLPIPANSIPHWVQYGTGFTTPANVTNVVVVMTNNGPGGNGNDFILDDITFQACGPIIHEGFGSTTGPASQSLCEGSNAVYALSTQVVGNGVPSYQWQKNLNGSAWTDMPGAVNSSLTVPFTNAVAGVYQYRLGVANGSAITNVGCRVYSPPLTVYVNRLPVVPPIADQTVCLGYPLLLNASGGATYTWTGPNMTPTSQNPLIINNVTTANAGTYTVVALSDSGCAAAPVTAKVTVVPKVVATVASPAISICAGGTAQLSASGGLFYKWTPTTGLNRSDIPNPVATPLQTTKYTVDVSNGGCSDSTQSVTVTVYQNPVADAGNEIFLFEGQSAKLNGAATGSNITSTVWSPATFLSNPNSLTPVATPTDDITYTLTVTSSTCGTSSSSVLVRVYKKITIPNTFSPNHDGVNDLWNIDALITYPQSIIRVFDRYGQQVFQSIGYTKPWDGTYGGSPLPAGTYYYIIDLKNHLPKITGWVLIVR
jgi:gliding motility-associated-like protein